MKRVGALLVAAGVGALAVELSVAPSGLRTQAASRPNIAQLALAVAEARAETEDALRCFRSVSVTTLERRWKGPNAPLPVTPPAGFGGSLRLYYLAKLKEAPGHELAESLRQKRVSPATARGEAAKWSAWAGGEVQRIARAVRAREARDHAWPAFTDRLSNYATALYRLARAVPVEGAVTIVAPPSFTMSRGAAAEYRARRAERRCRNAIPNRRTGRPQGQHEAVAAALKTIRHQRDIVRADYLAALNGDPDLSGDEPRGTLRMTYWYVLAAELLVHAQSGDASGAKQVAARMRTELDVVAQASGVTPKEYAQAADALHRDTAALAGGTTRLESRLGELMRRWWRIGREVEGGL